MELKRATERGKEAARGKRKRERIAKGLRGKEESAREGGERAERERDGRDERERQTERERERNASREVGGSSGSKKVDDKDGINKRKTHGKRTEDVNACVLYTGVRLISSATRRWVQGRWESSPRLS